MNQDVKNILSSLDTINDTITFEFFAPSLGVNIPSKILNTDQLKRLYKSLVDSPLQTSIFNLTFNEIMKENVITTETFKVDDLTALDKIIYFVTLRINSISKDYNFKYTKEEIEENGLIVEDGVVDLSDVLERFVEGLGAIETLIIDDVPPYKIVCGVPNIKTENKLENEVGKLAKSELKTSEDLRELVGNAFINEVTKYIKTLSVTDGQIIDFDTLDFKTRISIVSKFPTTIINKILKYMENFKTLTEKLTSISVEVVKKDVEGNDVVAQLKRELPMDASFFND